MSERILKALMQLFAIIAKVDFSEDGNVESGGRKIVELFLKKQLNQELVTEYLKLFDEFLNAHHSKSKRKDGSRKRTSLNSVKVLRICTQINEELTQRQKIVVLLRLLEFINADGEVTDQEDEFVTTVAETFNIDNEEYLRIRRFVLNDEMEDSPLLLYVDRSGENKFENAKYIYSEGLSDELRILRVVSVNIYFIRYLGRTELLLNGQPITNDRNYILTTGSSIRSGRVQPIYYSDIIAAFMADTDAAKLVFRADKIQYRFKGGKLGMHNLTFAEESGKLIGIMGGSGAGKSTLLNILNGNYKPSEGAVTINGIDIHDPADADSTEGVIGFISQDDLLIEELTVFQNLFYNAKLCFSQLSDNQIAKLVLRLLNQLGLYETKDLKVGSPMDKTISGGQRKRLNIALELIREPSVLFVDEPTSGLSSRDSENIMDLLKELALKGKLLFVVIHQPSSDIFKMFDKLMILDQGGYPIYYGDPVEAVIYFKRKVNHVNADESECITCGNVNPEQIFNIIESKVVDEFGNLTRNRKISPKEWNDYYIQEIEKQAEKIEDYQDTPDSTFKPPGKFKQFSVFMTRDVLSKLTNKQYMIINMLEAPVLAAILSFFVKFYDTNGDGSYIFRENENLPQYLFMSVVVALFIGLTVSAEEIIRDQKIRKRESFLNLSKGSYLSSKISIMFVISAIQSLLFVLVGNLILEIKGMLFAYWLIMFSTSCFANMLGLNISSSFNSAKVIYILIPFLIIPQLLFSGVIVKFDKLIPTFSSQSGVPFIGNIMASRWGYEALAVEQFKTNEYQSYVYEHEREMKASNWKKDFWVKRLRNGANTVRRELGKDEAERDNEVITNKLRLLDNELRKEAQVLGGIDLKMLPAGIQEKDASAYEPTAILAMLDEFEAPETGLFDQLFTHYKDKYTAADDRREDTIRVMTNDPDIDYKYLTDYYSNEALEKFVTNKNELTQVVEEDNELIQKVNLVYLDPHPNTHIFSAHFYAPQKRIFPNTGLIDTFVANVLMLWFMSLILVITLWFDALRKLIEGLGRLGEMLFSRGKGR